jgi:hypothetical protein
VGKLAFSPLWLTTYYWLIFVFVGMETKEKYMFKLFELITESIGWLQIAASPFLISAGIGIILYFSIPGITTLIIGSCITLIGLALGIYLATKAWKGNGTVSFLSRVSATPELDGKENNKL